MRGHLALRPAAAVLLLLPLLELLLQLLLLLLQLQLLLLLLVLLLAAAAALLVVATALLGVQRRLPSHRVVSRPIAAAGTAHGGNRQLASGKRGCVRVCARVVALVQHLSGRVHGRARAGRAATHHGLGHLERVAVWAQLLHPARVAVHTAVAVHTHRGAHAAGRTLRVGVARVVLGARELPLRRRAAAGWCSELLLRTVIQPGPNTVR